MSDDTRKHLYRVTVEVMYYALAETPREAQAWATEAVHDSFFEGDATLCRGPKCVYDYEPGELVYHAGPDDISIEQAMAIAFGAGDPETQAPPTGEAYTQTRSLFGTGDA